MITRLIDKIPNDVFKIAQNEISNIDWDLINDGRTTRTIAFADSKSLQIRISKQPAVLLENVHDWGKIVETVNHPVHYHKFPGINKLSEWVLQRVNGVKLGRVFIARLVPGGTIPPHIDLGEYFDIHARFHVPFQTTADVNFSTSPDDALEHMTQQQLYKLNNTVTHYAKNNGQHYRIHLILDIQLDRLNTNETFIS